MTADAHESDDVAPDSGPLALSLDLAESLLPYLRDPAAYLTAVEETFRDEGDDLIRDVKLTISLPPPENTTLPIGPKAQPNESLEPRAISGTRRFIFVALKPRKNSIATFQLLDTSSGVRCRRLPREIQKNLAQWLIYARFKSVLVLLEPIPQRQQQLEFVRYSKLLLRDLINLTVADPDTALDAYKDLFERRNAEGRTRFGRMFQMCLILDQGELDDAMASLSKLCHELTLRYYVAVEMILPSNDNRMAEIQYSYLQHYVDVVHGRRAKFRRWRRAISPDLRIHIPLAKLTDDYTVKMTAPAGYFFENQIVQYSSSAARKTSDASQAPSLAVRRYGMRKDEPSPKTLDGVVIERTSGRTAHLFLRNGSATRFSNVGPLHLWLTLRELPPGTTTRAFFVCLLALVANASLLTWAYVYEATGASLAPLVATLISLGSYVVEASTPDIPLVSAPVLPRTALQVQSLASMLFAIWLLGRTKGKPAPEHGWSARPFKELWQLWHSFAGITLLLALFVLTLFMLRRSYLVWLSYRHAILDRNQAPIATTTGS